LAILHVSIYDAVNGIARTNEPYLVQSSAPSSASREAAASAAAHQALVNLFPAAASSFDALHAAILAAIPNGPQKTAGIVWGEFVANQILAARATDGAGTETPPGHWNSIAQIIAAGQGNTLEENARLFALLNITMADAAICAWDAKYTFHFWRPVTAIAFVEPLLNWASFIVTPPFPDYVSGHSTFSGAAATVLPFFYDTEDLPFTIGSDFLPGVTRSFSTCLDAA